MWKAGLAAVVALVMGSSAALAGSADDFGRNQMVTKSEAVMSLAQVSRLKTVLKLNAAQEGFVQGIKHRAAAIALNAIALRRLASAAYPLLRTLDEEQKQSGLAFARSAGLHSVAAAF
jgi:hypothetical protein